MGTDVKQRLWVAGKGFKQLQGEAKVFGWCRFAIAHIVALHPVDNGQVIVFRDNPVRTQEWEATGVNQEDFSDAEDRLFRLLQRPRRPADGR